MELKLLELNTIDKNSKEADILVNKFKPNNENVKSLEKLFDVENSKDTIKLKYNQVKCFKWLKEKFVKLKSYLMARADAKPAVNAKLKVKPEAESAAEEKLNLEAFELIAQYIDKSLAEKLRKELNLANPFDDNGNANGNKRAKAQETIKIE